MAAVTAPSAMATPSTITASTTVNHAGEMPSMVSLGSVGRGKVCTPTNQTHIRSAGPFQIIGATTFFGFDAEPNYGGRPECDGNEEDDFEGGYYLADQERSFAPVACGVQGES
jgi:hypothetical protein